jgi:Glycosyl hydrolase family 30 TIM-barrel domain
MDETKPLMVSSSARSTNGYGFDDCDDRHGISRGKGASLPVKWLGLGVVAVFMVFFFGTWYGRSTGELPSTTTTTINLPQPPLTSGTTEDQETQSTSPASFSIRYRPFCMVHNKRVAFAGILQTSMGNPSQQWSHIPCYAQPERVRLWANNNNNVIDEQAININGFGAPDAIFRTSFSQLAFPKRPPIVGFGAAFTEAASLNYQSLSAVGKERLMELFFGKSGLGYSVGRVHINSCDFSVKSYSFDETDGDFELNDFDINVTHDAQPDGMIDMVLKATAVFRNAWGPQSDESNIDLGTIDDGNFKLFASPWSPPSWMKAAWSREDIGTGKTHATGMTGSTQPSCLREGTGKDSRYAKAWALYFSKFITACKSDW